MADVVRMEKWLSRLPRRQAAARREGPAEILLFTGVRYERLTAAAARKAAGLQRSGAPDPARRP